MNETHAQMARMNYHHRLPAELETFACERFLTLIRQLGENSTQRPAAQPEARSPGLSAVLATRFRASSPSERAMRPRGSGRSSPLLASPPSKTLQSSIPPSLLPVSSRLSSPFFARTSPFSCRTSFPSRASSTISFFPSFLPLSSFSFSRSEEHTSELQSRRDLVCRL